MTFAWLSQRYVAVNALLAPYEQNAVPAKVVPLPKTRTPATNCAMPAKISPERTAAISELVDAKPPKTKAITSVPTANPKSPIALGSVGARSSVSGWSCLCDAVVMGAKFLENCTNRRGWRTARRFCKPEHGGTG